MKIMNDEGVEIEVYTADEVKTRETAAATAAVTAKEKEFGTVKTTLENDLADAKKALGNRTGEFGQFRKLHEDVLAKLSVAERTIYENQKFMADTKEKEEAAAKANREKSIDLIIRAKVGSDDKLFGKVKDMYQIIGIEANTAEEIEKKTLAALGALGQTEPDLIASVSGFSGGSFKPPVAITDDDKSFADSERGKAGANELGLILEIPKKK